jgi:hypothetical protein
MRALAIVAVVAGTAHAQAPGETPPVEPAAPAVAPCSDCIDVMSDRWSVGFVLGVVGLQNQDKSEQLNLGGSELALRFRATPHLEVQAAFGSARESHDPNSAMTDYHAQLTTFEVALRYRFLPDRPWNVSVFGGLGTAQLDSDAERGQQRPMIVMGGGVERRFGRFGVHAELRIVALAAQMISTLIEPPDPYVDQMSGGQLVLGGSFYF